MATQASGAPHTIQSLMAARRVIKENLDNRYAADDSLRDQIGSAGYKRALAADYKRADLDIDRDDPKAPANHIGPWAKIAAVGAIARATESGVSGFGGAASSIVKGLGNAVTGLETGFSNIGTTILGMVLSPFGKSGMAITKAVQGLLGGLTRATGAAFGGVASVAKLGAGLVGGAVGGTLAAGGGLLGLGIGALAGSGGGPGGALVGASLGAAVTGLLTTGLRLVSDALGGVLSSIGRIFESLTSSLTQSLDGLTSAVKDMVQAASAQALATTSYERSGGISRTAGGQLASLATVLTGNPNGLASMFSNMSNMSIYAGAKGAFMGTRINPENPLGNVQNAYSRYKQVGKEYGALGPLEQIVYLKVMGMEALAPLFSAGQKSVSLALDTARRIAPTAQETTQNLTLTFQIAAIQADLDRLKTRFLSDLMPAIEAGLGVFTKWFRGNEGRILKAGETIGRFLYVQLPSYLEKGINALFDFGQKFAAALPSIFKIGIEIITAGIASIQKIAGELGNNFFVKHGSPELAKDLTGFSKMHLTESLGLSNPNATKMRAEATRLRAEADDTMTALSMGDESASKADIDAVKQKRKRADELDEAAKQGSPLAALGQVWGKQLSDTLRSGQQSVSQGFKSNGLSASQESRRAHNFDTTFQHGQPQPTVHVNINAKVHDNPEALHKLQLDFSHKIGQQQLRAIQRSN